MASSKKTLKQAILSDFFGKKGNEKGTCASDQTPSCSKTIMSKKRRLSHKDSEETKGKRLFDPKWKVDFPGLEDTPTGMVCTICIRHQEWADRSSTFVTGNDSYRTENIQAHFKSPEHLQCQEADQVQARIQQGQCAGPLHQRHENLEKLHTMEEIDAQSSDSLNTNITAQDSSVYAPTLHDVHVTGSIVLNQIFTGTNISKSQTRDVTAVITEYKELIVSKYKYTREYDSLAGEQVLLADRYVDPLILPQHRIKKEREKEMRFKGNYFFNLKTYDLNRSISASNLFSQEHGPNNDCPKAVILQGNSGNGKSFITQKIMLDWAEGNLFAGIFDVVFHLRCTKLNVISEKISLVELLNCSEEMTPILKDKQKRILFLVDGFDELRCSLPEMPLPATVYDKAEPRAFLSSLLRGNMLKDAFLLVTTRSTSTEQLSKLLKCPQRFTEIMGFSEKGVGEYFQQFCKDTDLSKHLHEQVKTYETLYTACFSPVMCWLICTSFKQINMNTRMTGEFKSTTSVFIDFVFTLLDHHCQDLNQSEKFSLLKHLGQLAEDGMRKGEILFARPFVPEIILTRVGLPFLCTFTHKDGVRMKEMFSFLHLSFQEFFAALFYILQDKTEAVTRIKQLLLSDSDQFQFSQNSHMFPVIQFLFGLSNEKAINFINENHEVSREIGSLLVQWMQAFVKSDLVEFYSTFPLHCLYEVNDENVVKNVMKIWETRKSGVEIMVSSSQMSEYHAAAYCLQFCRCIRHLDLHANTMQTLNMMEAVLTKCEKTNLTVEHVSDEDVGCLILTLGKVKDLECLSLNDGSLSDDSVQIIMSHLYKQRSVDVELPVKAINHKNTEIIMEFFKGKTEPIQLRLFLSAATLRNKEESLCSHFTVDNFKMYHINLGHEDVDTSVKYGLALRYLTVDFDSVITNSDLRNLLTISYNLKESDNPQFEEHVDALLSFLNSIPGLTTVSLGAETLSLDSAAKILTFLRKKPDVRHNLTQFVVNHLKSINDEDICSLLLFTDIFRDDVTLQLEVKVHSSSFQDSHETESKPELLKVSLTFSLIESATVNWEDLLKTITQLMKSDQRLRVDNDGETLGIIRGDSLSLSDKKWKLYFGCCHFDLAAVDEPDCHGDVLPCITLTMAKHRKFYRDIWEEFFHHYKQLKAMTELCPEYDQCLVKMLDVMKTVPALKEVKLTLRFLTVHGASCILHLFQTSSSLWKFDLDAEIEKDKLDLRSELSLRKSTENKCRLALRCNHSNPDTKAFFGYISLIVSKTSEKTESWRNFFQSYYETKGLTERDPDFSQKTSAFLSSLYRVSGLEEVEFSLHRITESWTRGTMVFLSSNLVSTSRTYCALNRWYGVGACPSLTIKRNITDSMVPVKIYMQSNPLQRSLIHLKISCSEISNIDVAGLFCRLRCLEGLNDTSQEYDVKVNELISLLHSVPNLQKLKLEIKNLTSTWVTRVLSFKTCQSLQKIFVHTTAGGMLSEEAISELEKNWTCQDCVLVLIGGRCSNSMKKVKLSFHEGHYSEEPFLLFETDNEWTENTFNRFTCYSDCVEEKDEKENGEKEEN